jgi:phosphoribosylaminoimidazole carboxylase PurE protein
MGSTTDLPVMRKAAETLAEFSVPFETRIVSAHRTPEEMVDYGRSAMDRGVEAIIAGAGGAAHLPGMLAALTVVPVIGVPVPVGPLAGVDALMSIVQMPRGTPVATVAIGNATNAAFVALQMLGMARPELRTRLLEYRSGRRQAVRRDDVRVRDEGWGG